jgi:hypothetical protein
MIDRKHDPEIDGLRNMLCSKGTLAGILILCDLLEPVIVFSDYLQGASIDFSHVNKKAKVKILKLIVEIYDLISD